MASSSQEMQSPDFPFSHMYSPTNTVRGLSLVRLAGWLDGWLISRERKILLAGWLAGGWADFA